MKMRFRDVDQDDNIGTARRDAMGRGIRERREESDILGSRPYGRVEQLGDSDICCVGRVGSRVGACLFSGVVGFVMPVLVLSRDDVAAKSHFCRAYL